jgi:hypothetical protein
VRGCSVSLGRPLDTGSSADMSGGAEDDISVELSSSGLVDAVGGSGTVRSGGEGGRDAGLEDRSDSTLLQPINRAISAKAISGLMRPSDLGQFCRT